MVHLVPALLSTLFLDRPLYVLLSPCTRFSLISVKDYNARVWQYSQWTLGKYDVDFYGARVYEWSEEIKYVFCIADFSTRFLQMPCANFSVLFRG